MSQPRRRPFIQGSHLLHLLSQGQRRRHPCYTSRFWNEVSKRYYTLHATRSSLGFRMQRYSHAGAIDQSRWTQPVKSDTHCYKETRDEKPRPRRSFDKSRKSILGSRLGLGCRLQTCDCHSSPFASPLRLLSCYVLCATAADDP